MKNTSQWPFQDQWRSLTKAAGSKIPTIAGYTVHRDRADPIVFMPLSVKTTGVMIISSAFFASTLIVKRLPANELPRSRISFDFFALSACLILRVLWVCFWLSAG
jgi:hypothetical protein